jgi:hypothetical protein
MRHDMELRDQGGEDQDEAWLDGSVASVKDELRLWNDGPRDSEASLSKTWRRWTDATVKSKLGQDR